MAYARSRMRAAPLLVAAALLGTRAHAQREDPASTPATLPRPGYDRPPPISIGSMALRLDFDLAALYDSNVYATHSRPRDDGVLQARFRASLANEHPGRLIHAEVHAERDQHVELGRETSTSFGALLRTRTDLAKDQIVNASLRYDRGIESRADPEARANSRMTPRKIDSYAGEAGYALKRGRLGAELSLGMQYYNYLDPNEHDRDLRAYQGSILISHQLNFLSLFVSPYITRRDFVARTDFSGVNRDATTIGGLIGLSHSGGGLLRGRVGVGLFRFRPDSALLKPFTGFAAKGDVTWTPRPRTAVTVAVFSGDVATVRVGASGRHDSSISLRIDQEARHNLLLDGSIAWDQTRYRGAPNEGRDTIRFQGGATYLINRGVALIMQASITRRSADRDINSFNRRTVSIGVRFQR